MLLLTALLTILTFTTAAPLTPSTSAKRCTTLIEEEPWIISNLTVFTASSPSTQSSISFHFTDLNTGLNLDTDCHRAVTLSTITKLEDGKYYTCGNEDVEFMYSSAGLEVQKVYEDDCLGPWPYNSATAVGMSGTLKMEMKGVDGGTAGTVGEMPMPITEMA